MSFKDFKKKRQGFEKMAKKMEESSGNGERQEELKNAWYPERDKNGNAYAVIRFLPAKDNDKDPFIKRFDHFFNHNGQWLIENCPTTIGNECPVCLNNKELWSSDPDTVRKRKRNLSYFAQIYIVDDPTTPENNGKVKDFRYGAAIQKIIEQAYKPEFADETPIDVFDLWDGANFKLKIRKVDGRTNYDKSEFEKKPHPLFDEDDELEAIYDQIQDISFLVAEDKFKSEDAIQKRLDKVLGNNVKQVPNAESMSQKVEKEIPNESSKSKDMNDDEESIIDFFESLDDD